MQALAPVLIGLLVGIFVVGAVCFRRAVGRYKAQIALNAPLLDSSTAQVARLQLDAQAPSRACLLCAFANLPHSDFCVLCGTAMPVERPSRRREWWRRLGAPAETTQEHDISPPPPLSHRQRRVMRRREWTRQVGDKAAGLVWRHTHVCSEESTDRSTSLAHLLDRGYVVDDGSALSSALNLGSSNLSTTDLQHAASPLEEVVVVRTDLEASSSNLQLSNSQSSAPAACRPMRISEVRDGTPATLAAVEHAAGMETPQAFCALAAQDFPTKLAHFATVTTSLRGEADSAHPPIQLNVARSEAYNASLTLLSQVPASQVRSSMRIHFEGESGVDAGGLLREWFCLVAEGLVGESETRVFAAANDPDQTFNLDASFSSLDQQLAYSRAAGRFVGRALLEGVPLGFHLSLPLLKIILGVPITFDDLEYVDPESFRSLNWLLEHDDVGGLALTFAVSESRGGADSRMVEHELVPGGASVDVTDANKLEFVMLKFHYLVFGRVEHVLTRFVSGIYEVIPRSLLMLFDPEELDYLLSGSDAIDVDDWRRNTRYNADLQGHLAMRWFWELVQEMPLEYRRRLLRFATGSSRVPVGGFAALTSHDGRSCPFTLRGVSWRVSGGYIRSHACFNRLDLPLYAERVDLEHVLYALLDAEVQGFTTA